MGASQVALVVRTHLPMQESEVSLGAEDPLQEEMATHSVFLPGESHGQRSPVGYSACGCKELDTTEHAGNVFKALLSNT